MFKMFRGAICAGLVACAVVMGGASQAGATLVTYNLKWTSPDLGSTAMATGVLTLDPATLLIAADPSLGVPYTSLGISDFTLTISNANSGNGTYGLGDFADFYWLRSGASLDLSTELVTQAAGSGTWGDGTNGDFNFDFVSSNFYPSAPLTLQSTDGDTLRLISFAPVPEPATLALVGIGLLGLGVLRRRAVKQLARIA